MSPTYIHYLALIVLNQEEIAPRILAGQDNISWSQYRMSWAATRQQREVWSGKVLILNPQPGRWTEEAISQTSPFKVFRRFVWPTFIIRLGKNWQILYKKFVLSFLLPVTLLWCVDSPV